MTRARAISRSCAGCVARRRRRREKMPHFAAAAFRCPFPVRYRLLSGPRPRNPQRVAGEHDNPQSARPQPRYSSQTIRSIEPLETNGAHHSFNIRSRTPRSSATAHPCRRAGNRRPGAAFWRARVAFEGVEVVFCQKRAVLLVWCTDWLHQKNAMQHAAKEWVFLSSV